MSGKIAIVSTELEAKLLVGLDDAHGRIKELKAQIEKLRIALVTVQSHYKLFVGPDDKIANSVSEIVTKALEETS